MRVTEIADRPTGQQRRDALEFAARVGEATGSPALSDHLRLDLVSPGEAPPLLVTVRDPVRLIATAQVSQANASSVLEVVTDPELSPGDAVDVRDDVAETAVDLHRRAGGDPVVWWVDDPTDHDTEIARRLGLEPIRELFEMRRPLPHPDHAVIETRDFAPGRDDEAWLGVNNRAFAGHGEQGGWTRETFVARQAEPWFDPAGFRVHDDADGRMLGFCWTKLHHETDPVIGEIYVIAVDPAAHGRGLGRQLTLAGLDSISARGVTIANLYVDADNTAAVALYDRLGFTVHRRRLAFGSPGAPS